MQWVEEQRLEAGGLNLLTARRRAQRVAKAMMLTIVQWREEQQLLGAGADQASGPGPPLLDRLKHAARQPEPVLEPHEPRPGTFLRRIDAWAGLVLGRGLRFLMAAALLGLLAVWLDARGIITAGQVREQAEHVRQVWHRASVSADPKILLELRWKIPIDWRRLQEPLELDWLPAGPWQTVRGMSLAGAAMILLLSLRSTRKRTGFLALLGAGIALAGAELGLTVPGSGFGLGEHGACLVLGSGVFLLDLLIPKRQQAA